jgi:hypothetical protein
MSRIVTAENCMMLDSLKFLEVMSNVTTGGNRTRLKSLKYLEDMVGIYYDTTTQETPAKRRKKVSQ